MKYVYLAASIGWAVIGWFTKVSADNKITQEEIVELVAILAELYSQQTGKKIEFDLPKE